VNKDNTMKLLQSNIQTNTQSILTLSILSLAILSAQTNAQSLDCLIQPHQIVQVGSAVPGVIERIHAERGDVVKLGQVLVQLQSSVERANLSLAQSRAKIQGEVSAAEQSSDFAVREHKRAAELAQKNFVSQNYVDKASTEAQVAGSKLTQAKERKTVAGQELEVAQAQLAMRTIKSPISGVVTDRFMASGELVEDKPLMRIAQVDPLRVEVVVPASVYGQLQRGMQATVLPEFANAKSRTAQVSIVDKVVDPASNTFRVRLEMPNPQNDIPAGLRCKVDLGIKIPSAAPSSLPVKASKS
jgi:membrane fusion protein, heavy metal efflux system